MIKIAKSKLFNYYLPLILTAIVLIVSAGIYWNYHKPAEEAGAAWYNSGWQYRKPITIDHTKLSTTATSTFSSFPLLISVTDSQLKTIANGGLVASSTGADILFTDSNGTTKLDHEIETYASSTGQLIAWLRIPTLTSASDYPIYIYFGNASATNQQNASGVWDSNYKVVYHMADNAANTTVIDSTSNANNAKNSVNTNTKTATGQINGGLNYTNASSNSASSTATITLVNNVTFSSWVKGASIGQYRRILETYYGLSYYLGSNNDGSQFDWIINSASGFENCIGGTVNNSWHYVVGTYDGTTAYLYVDGARVCSYTGFTPPGSTTYNLFIAKYSNGALNYWDGTLDDARVSNTNRSADWIATEYNNQSSPSTFYAYGAVGVQNRSASTAGVAVASHGSSSSWYSSSWTYRKPITIDRNKLSTTATTTFSSFPLLVSLTDLDLRSTGNGGKQASSTGVDILFADSNGITKLDHEVETYASTTGQLIAWVRIPTLTSSSDYPIYIYFGNSGASNQSNAAGVWNSNYKAIWHLPNGTSLTANDSTANNNCSLQGSPTAVAGKVDGGASFGTNNYLSCGTNSSTANLTTTTPATFSFWMNRLTTTDGMVMGRNDNNVTNGGWWVELNSAPPTGAAGLRFQAERATVNMKAGAALPSANTWTFVTFVTDGSSTAANQKIYYDGVLQSLTTSINGSGASADDSAQTMYIANNRPTNPQNLGNFSGYLDEVELSNSARSADWIATEYTNQSSPSTFYAYGALGMQSRGASTANLDTTQTTINGNGFGLDTTEKYGFTFVPTTSGKLSEVDPYLYMYAGTTNDVTVELWSVSNLIPSAKLADLGTLNHSTMDQNYSYRTLIVPSNVQSNVTAGTTYAVVFYTAGNGSGTYATNTDNKTSSNSHTAYQKSGTWYPGDVYQFKTYIASTLDANYSSGGTGFGIADTNYRAIQFTAGATGILNQAKVVVYLYPSSLAAVNAAIWSDNNNVPGSLLTNGSMGRVAAASMDGSYSDRTFTPGTGPSVTSGTKYWLVFWKDNTDGAGDVAIQKTTLDAAATFFNMTSTDSGSNWLYHQLLFKTYVNPSPPMPGLKSRGGLRFR